MSLKAVDKIIKECSECNITSRSIYMMTNNNIGANLQHYNPLIDDVVQYEFNIPQNWRMVAQMPFGGISSTPFPHTIDDIDKKFIVLG